MKITRLFVLTTISMFGVINLAQAESSSEIQPQNTLVSTEQTHVHHSQQHHSGQDHASHPICDTANCNNTNHEHHTNHSHSNK